eukprot:6469388-Amphidinium_carterae.1
MTMTITTVLTIILSKKHSKRKSPLVEDVQPGRPSNLMNCTYYVYSYLIVLLSLAVLQNLNLKLSQRLGFEEFLKDLASDSARERVEASDNWSLLT